VQLNRFFLQASIMTDAPLGEAKVTTSNLGVDRVLDLLVNLLGRNGGTFGVSLEELLAPGLNTLTLSASNCAGESRVVSTIRFVPTPADERIVFLAMDVVAGWPTGTEWRSSHCQ
jgi:hypothetical protein